MKSLLFTLTLALMVIVGSGQVMTFDSYLPNKVDDQKALLAKILSGFETRYGVAWPLKKVRGTNTFATALATANNLVLGTTIEVPSVPYAAGYAVTLMSASYRMNTIIPTAKLTAYVYSQPPTGSVANSNAPPAGYVDSPFLMATFSFTNAWQIMNTNQFQVSDSRPQIAIPATNSLFVVMVLNDGTTTGTQSWTNFAGGQDVITFDVQQETAQ